MLEWQGTGVHILHWRVNLMSVSDIQILCWLSETNIIATYCQENAAHLTFSLFELRLMLQHAVFKKKPILPPLRHFIDSFMTVWYR